MRRIMICVSVMLAMVQLWPLVFGHANGDGTVARPRLVPEAQAAVKPAAVRNPARARPAPTGMPTCYQRYERAYAACSGGQASCQLRAGDNWDVCEATGFWPE